MLFRSNVTTDAPVTIELWGSDSIWSSVLKVYYLGVQQSAPFSMDTNESFEVRLNVCSGAVSETDSISVKFEYDGGLLQTFIYDFESISLASTISLPTIIDFGTVAVGGTKIISFNLINQTVSCLEYSLSTNCDEILVKPTDVSDILCNGDTQGFYLEWKPTIVGSLSCQLYLNGCSELLKDVIGTAIEAPSGGGTPSGQKNKVDQTSPVQQCSPRTANNR